MGIDPPPEWLYGLIFHHFKPSTFPHKIERKMIFKTPKLA